MWLLAVFFTSNNLKMLHGKLKTVINGNLKEDLAVKKKTKTKQFVLVVVRAGARVRDRLDRF